MCARRPDPGVGLVNDPAHQHGLARHQETQTVSQICRVPVCHEPQANGVVEDPVRGYQRVFDDPTHRRRLSYFERLLDPLHISCLPSDRVLNACYLPQVGMTWVMPPSLPTGTMTSAKGEPSAATNAGPIGFPSAPRLSLSTPMSALVRDVP